MIIALLVLVVIVAYMALHLGEHPAHRPGIGRPLTIGLIVLAAWLCWPLYGSYLVWLLPR